MVRHLQSVQSGYLVSDVHEVGEDIVGEVGGVLREICRHGNLKGDHHSHE